MPEHYFQPFKHKPHFLSGAKYPLAPDAQREPPIPCDLNLGDKVAYTNEFGAVFEDRVVTGFCPTVEGQGRFVYLDNSSWWFPVNPESLRLQ